MASSGAMVLGTMGLLAALACLAASEFISMPTDDVQFISMPTDDVQLPSSLSSQSCPNLEVMVHDAVAQARKDDITVVGGLLRIFFHDCFPNGCDASILLDKRHVARSEQDMPQNGGLHQGALDLIENIHKTVHGSCKQVSCADITMLATREAVVQSGGPGFHIELGRKDSLGPAEGSDVNKHLPRRETDIKELIRVLESRGFNKTDLVVLSGAHTVGKTSCGSIQIRTGDNAPFVHHLKNVCSAKPRDRQDLDVTTPHTFDNKYYSNLLIGKGVLKTDMELLNDEETKSLVQKCAQDQAWFFWKFGEAMGKMVRLPVKDGQYRNNCFRPNTRLSRPRLENLI